MDPSNLRPPASGAEMAAFLVFAAMALAGAGATVLAKNPIRSAVGLFFHVLALAGLYLTLSAHFLAVVQLIVYAGAVVVLFVFVIMILGPGADTVRDRRGVVARAISLLALIAIGAILVPQVGYLERVLPARPTEYGTLWQIGHHLFNRAVLPFELVSVLLVIAMIGAMGIARGPRKRAPKDTAGQPPRARGDLPPGRLIAPIDPRLSTRDATVVAEPKAEGTHTPENHS
jgi:NADH-quinone oxidoreductase subunit J